MSPQIVHYNSRRVRIPMLTNSGAETVLAGNMVRLWARPGEIAATGSKFPSKIKLVTPTGLEPVFSP